MRTSALFLSAIISAAILSTANAAPKAIKFKLKSALPAGYRVMATSTDGSAAKTATISGKSVKIAPPKSTALVYVLDSENNVAYQLVNKYCTGKKYTNCSRKNIVNTVFKAGTDLGTVKKLSGALLASVNGSSYKKSLVSTITATATNWVPTGIASHGLAARAGGASLHGSAAHANRIGTFAAPGDEDADGLVDPVDSDNDGDGTLDNYDNDSNNNQVQGSFHVFSNFKLDIDQSLNYNTTGLDTAKIDNALQGTQSLAIEVSAPDGTEDELDCGSLGYCSLGGTGTANSGAFPDAVDSDNDGLGTIVKGGTGDFQLQTHATTSTIGAGDTYLQKYTVEGKSYEVPGMLNFMFVSNPAVESVAVNSDGPTTIDYLATPMLGSRNNCIAVPSGGDVSVTLTGWRPQRPGDSSLGEGTYVDIGGSLITIDVPNGPSVNGGGTQGPGNCSAASYSTSDSGLTTDPNGLRDLTTDHDADPTNKYSFTVNVSQCLNDAHGGAITWNAGEKLFLDLQFRSSAGDNAAQKFCLQRAN